MFVQTVNPFLSFSFPMGIECLCMLFFLAGIGALVYFLVLRRQTPVGPPSGFPVAPPSLPPGPPEYKISGVDQRLQASSLFDVLRTEWPLLLSVHLLIFSAAVFGMHFGTSVYYDVQLPAPGFQVDGLLHFSEWAMDFWIGGFAVAVDFVALLLVLLTMFTPRRVLWQGSAVVISGAIIGVAVLLFKLDSPPTQFDMVRPELSRWALTHFNPELVSEIEARTFIARYDAVLGTRESRGGSTLGLATALLLVLGGSVMLKHAPAPPEPRFSRLAIYALAAPAAAFILLAAIMIIRLNPGISPGGDDVRPTVDPPPVLIVAMIGCPVALTVLGIVATWRIKRSGGKLRGLRLAAMEAIFFPLFMAADLIGLAVFWGMVGLLMLLLPQQAPFPPANAALAVPLVLITILAALLLTFFLGRAIWRAIVGRPAKVPVLNVGEKSSS